MGKKWLWKNDPHRRVGPRRPWRLIWYDFILLLKYELEVMDIRHFTFFTFYPAAYLVRCVDKLCFPADPKMPIFGYEIPLRGIPSHCQKWARGMPSLWNWTRRCCRRGNDTSMKSGRKSCPWRSGSLCPKDPTTFILRYAELPYQCHHERWSCKKLSIVYFYVCFVVNSDMNIQTCKSWMWTKWNN